MSFSYADLSNVFLYAQYLEWVEKGAMHFWFNDTAALANSTDYGTILSVATGSTQGPQAFTPGTPSGNNKVAAYKATVIPAMFQDNMFVDRASLKGDITGVFDSRFQSMSTLALTFKQNSFIDLLASNPTDWTNNPFFGSHTYANPAGGNFAAQTNVFTYTQVASLAVVSAAAPTPLEMDQAIFDVITKAQGFTTEAGTIATADATDWAIVCSSPAVYGSVKRALNNTMLAVEGGGNADSIMYSMTHGPNGSAGEWDVDAWYQPNLATVDGSGCIGANDFLMLRKDAAMKPCIIGADPDVSEFLGLGSEFDVQNYGVKFLLYSRYAFAPGHWHAAVKATLSNS